MVRKPVYVVFAALIALSCSCRLAVTQPICFVEWSISNSYTIASSSTSYVTLNLYASNNGTEDLMAPYNLTIYNPAYVDVFSWNFEVTGALDGVITGDTLPGNAFWETLLAGSKNVVNMGGNVETEELGAPPLEITIGGYRCQLSERLEGDRDGTPGSAGSSSGSSGGSSGTSAGGSSGASAGGSSGASAGGSGSSGTGVTQQGTGGSASGSKGSQSQPGSSGGSGSGSAGSSGGAGNTGSTIGGTSGNGGGGGSSGVGGNSGTGGIGGGTGGSGFIAPVPGPAEAPLSPLTSPVSAPSPSV